MIGVIGISLSILVMLGGLYLLAKSKKDSLGNLYIFSSYSAIVLGFLLFAGTIVGGACMMRHNSNGQSSCYMNGSGGSSCGQSMSCMKGNSSCGMHQKACFAKKHCNSSAECTHHGDKSSYGHHGEKSSFKHHGEKSSCKNRGSKAHEKGKYKEHKMDSENEESNEEVKEKGVEA